MAFAYRSVPFQQTARSEQLARLVYELLDAHCDTERLVRKRPTDLEWGAHLSYLRDLQRLGRQVLAEPLDCSAVD